MTEFSPIDRTSPDYIEAIVAKKPHQDDPKDIRIRTIIEQRFLQEPWARHTFGHIRDEQITYLQDVIEHVDEPEYVDAKTQDVLQSIANELRSTVEDGSSFLKDLPKGQPALIMTNHLGAYKLTGINPQTDINNGVENYPKYDFMYPYPLYFAALKPVADAIGDKLSYTSDDFPGVYGKIHSEAGFIHVPPASIVTNGRTEALIKQTGEVIKRTPNIAIVNFPEGGTSGKYNEAGPYDLLDFKTGGYVVAAELDMTVIPVAQYFDPHKGMRLKVFAPLQPAPSSREEYQAMATKAQTEMQTWLSAKEAAQAQDDYFATAKAA